MDSENKCLKCGHPGLHHGVTFSDYGSDTHFCGVIDCDCDGFVSRLPNHEYGNLVLGEDGGMKCDGGKPRMELLPMAAIREVAKVMTFGANKYAPNNWKKVEISRYIGALLRHLATYMEGEHEIDEDSGLPTLAHLACDTLFVLDLYLKGKKFEIK